MTVFLVKIKKRNGCFLLVFSVPVTCEASNEDPALCIKMQHAACKRPRVLNSDSPTVDQPVPQWHILPIMGVPVPDKDAYVNQEELIKEPTP